MDDKNNKGGQDRSRISMNQDHEVQYWSKKFGVSEEELQQAVEAVGDQADDVERYLSEE